MTNSNEFIEFTNKFLGYGRPQEAKCFYFGSEEHGSFDKVEYEKWKLDLKNIPKGYYYNEFLRSKVQGNFEEKISNLENEIKLNFYNKEKSENLNLSQEYFGFYGNVKPIGDENEGEWSVYNANKTGFTSKNDYFNHIWNVGAKVRQNVLFNYLEFLKKKIEFGENILIFNFGSVQEFSPFRAMLPLYRKLNFEFDEEYIQSDEFVHYHGNDWLLHSKCHRVWFTAHPAAIGSLNSEVIKRIIDKISSSDLHHYSR